MKQTLFIAAFLSIVISLFAQQNLNINQFSRIDTGNSDVFLMNTDFQNNAIQNTIRELDDIRNATQIDETTLDSVVHYHYFSESDSVKETKGEYEWYDWGGWKTDYIYTWDEPNKLWVNYERSEYTFNTNYLLSTTEIFRWDTGQNDWKNYRGIDQFYDAFGNTDSIKQLVWSEELQRWDKSVFFEYQYDDSGNRTLFIWWKGDENNEWRQDNKREYAYITDGNVSTELFYKWDTLIDDWLVNSKREYYYNNSSLLDTSYFSVWESNPPTSNFLWGILDTIDYVNGKFNEASQAGEWDLWSMNTYEYDENDNKILWYMYGWDEDQWNLGGKADYEYDDHNTRISYLSSSWNEDDSTWVNNYKSENEYTYEYGEEARTIMSSSHDWDVDYEVWIGRSKREYFHNNEGKSRLNIYSDWNEFTNDWEVYEKEFVYRSELLEISGFEIDDLLVYPNPVKNTLNIKNQNNQKVHCSIISISGQKLRQFDMITSEVQINIEDLPNGVYFLQISKGSKTTVQKIIKQ